MKNRYLIFGAGALIGGLAMVAPFVVAQTQSVKVDLPDTKLVSDVTDGPSSVSVIENKDDRCYIVTKSNYDPVGISCVKIASAQ